MNFAFIVSLEEYLVKLVHVQLILSIIDCTYQKCIIKRNTLFCLHGHFDNEGLNLI